MDSNEAFYDTEIAPKLLELAKACEARGMSFVAMVEYAPGESGETCCLAPDENRSIKPLVAYWGVKCRGNVDSFNLAAARHAHKHGHSSLRAEHLRNCNDRASGRHVSKRCSACQVGEHDLCRGEDCGCKCWEHENKVALGVDTVAQVCRMGTVETRTTQEKQT